MKCNGTVCCCSTGTGLYQFSAGENYLHRNESHSSRNFLVFSTP